MNKFIVGKKYKRPTILDSIGVPESPTGNPNRGGIFSNGYFKFNNAYYIFTNIGVAGRTGHDYPNKFISPEKLEWYGKTKSNVSQAQIIELLDNTTEVHIFYRTNDRDPFIYAGLGIAVSHKEIIPVQITWEILSPSISYKALKQDPSSQILSEGKAKYIVTKHLERNPQARDACIKYYGYNCSVCSFNFKEIYGDLGENFIHVHHINPLATINREYLIDPIKGLRPVCPNCHAMIHRGNEALNIENLKNILKNNSK